jgi:hypothetical protein
VGTRGGRGTGALTTVAVVVALALGWRSITMLLDWRVTAAQLRLDTFLGPSGARLAATVVSAFGVVVAALLLHPRTRVPGGWIAAGGMLLLAGYLIVVWMVGDPVGCLCSVSARRGDWFTRGEAIVIALAASIITGVIARGSSHSASRGGGEPVEV